MEEEEKHPEEEEKQPEKDQIIEKSAVVQKSQKQGENPSEQLVFENQQS